MRGIILDINRPIESRLLDPATRDDLGGAAKSINRKLFKPIREFTFKSWDQLFRDQMEIIRNAVHGGRVSGVFWLDGDQYGNITEPIHIGQGNGSQLEFPMPVDNPFPSSWKIWVNQTLTTGWTMSGSVLTFSSAPSGRITGIGKRKFRVIMLDNNDSILGETQLYKNDAEEGVYTMQPITFLEVEAVASN